MRKVADPGPGPDRALPAHAPDDPGPDDPRLRSGNGTTSLFAAFDLASGSVIAQPYRRHRHQEFLRFLTLIDTAVPRRIWTCTWSCDNYATHKTPAIHQWLLKHPRFH